MVMEMEDFQEPKHRFTDTQGDGYCGCGEDDYYANHFSCFECDNWENLDFVRDPITDDEVWICGKCYKDREKQYNG